MNDHGAIQTERLLLTPLATVHAEALHEVYADPQAMRFWHTLPHGNAEDTRALIAEFVAGTERCWALTLRDSSEAIGVVYFLGNTGAPGMGYILSPRHWGRGLMSEAVRGALEYGFTTLAFDRAELWIDADNSRSQRLAERTGFTRRAVFPNKYPHARSAHETVVYGLRISELRPQAAAKARPIRAYSAQPILGVADVRATANYYRDKLGFEIMFLVGDPPTFGGVSLSEWMGTGVRIHLTQTAGRPATSAVSLYLVVGPGIDALHEAYRARGVDLAGEIVRQPWGMREFTLRDCNGYVLRFGTPG